MSFNHFDAQGQAIMVDVSGKKKSLRTAIAEATVRMQPQTLTAILEATVSKGDVLGVARLAGIGAAKKTPDLIPLSHSVAALTVYDMCKGADKGISISEVSLLYKEGGKSGVYRRGDIG